MKRIGIATILAVWVLPSMAQTPDWTGYYTLARGRDLGNFKPLNENLPEVIYAHLQPWAKAKMAATDGIAEDTGQLCQPTGIFRNPPFAGSFQKEDS